MKKRNTTIQVIIDNQPLKVSSGITILEAAREHDIFIPTLCAHEELSPHGGCRMCIVEVEGMRNLPTACTTPIQDGMIIRTHTAQLQETRMEILQLYMSEHTSSCLICDEKDDCKRFMPTIRKAGVTTGCRYCPNDGQCEFQTLAEQLGVTEIKYPIYYRGMRVETEDPFYDRDYNLCVLCGRCVRMCQEIRTANVLAFTNRGRQTVIGPAYGRTHLEAGCEFCGACVSVCPTGTLREKTRAWEGKEDREEITTCTFCGVGCQVRLQIKGDRIIGSLPAPDPLVNNAQLCVKGRFCGTELANGPLRLRNPYQVIGGTKAEISWETSATTAAEKLADCRPDEFAMLVSPNCSNEDLYVAQKFARVAMHSNNIDTSARLFYGSGFDAYLNLFKMSSTLQEMQKATAILCLGLDSRFARSVVAVALRKAARRGAKIITIHPREHNLTLMADKWIQPLPGEEVSLLENLAKLIGKGVKKAGTKAAGMASRSNHSRDLSEVAEMLRGSEAPMILIGSEFLQYDSAAAIFKAVEGLAQKLKAGILPLPSLNNLVGSVLMGAYGELLPGGNSASNAEKRKQLAQIWGARVPGKNASQNAKSLAKGAKVKVLYLVGEVPTGWQPNAEYVIFQNIYPPDGFCHADLVLPAAAYTEADGSFINGEGRVQRLNKGVPPFGGALPDWQILSQIAKKLGVQGFGYTSIEGIRKEIAKVIGERRRVIDFSREPKQLALSAKLVPRSAAPAAKTKSNGKFPFLLSISAIEHSHRGFPLSTWVEGSKMLLTEEVLEINPHDATKAGIDSGAEVVIISDHFEKTLPVKLVSGQPAGTLHASLHDYLQFNPNPHPVKIRRKKCSG